MSAGAGAPPLVFIVICPRCGERVATIEVDGTWREATLWADLANADHASERHAVVE